MERDQKGITGCRILLILLILVWKSQQAAVICNDQDGDKPGGNKRGPPSGRHARSLVVLACGKQIHPVCLPSRIVQGCSDTILRL